MHHALNRSENARRAACTDLRFKSSFSRCCIVELAEATRWPVCSFAPGWLCSETLKPDSVWRPRRATKQDRRTGGRQIAGYEPDNELSILRLPFSQAGIAGIWELHESHRSP